jgi:hypothetical protein
VCCLRFVPAAAWVFVLRESGVRLGTFFAGVRRGWDGDARKTVASVFSGVIGRGLKKISSLGLRRGDGVSMGES